MKTDTLRSMFPRTVEKIERDALDRWLFDRFYKKNKLNDIDVLITDEGTYQIKIKFIK